MRGHEPIIAMRMKRVAPDRVFVSDIRHDPRWQDFTDATAKVAIVPGEAVGRLDLRWSVGLALILIYSDRPFAVDLHRAFLNAGASSISTLVNEGEQFEMWVSDEHGNRAKKWQQ